MKFEIDYIEKPEISDHDISDLLTQVYVDAGFVTPDKAKSLFLASSKK